MEGRALVEAIDAHPKHNENEAPADDLIRFLKAAAAIARHCGPGTSSIPTRRSCGRSSGRGRSTRRWRMCSRWGDPRNEFAEAVATAIDTVRPRTRSSGSRRRMTEGTPSTHASRRLAAEPLVPAPEPDVDDAPWAPPDEDEEDLADALTRHLNQQR